VRIATWNVNSLRVRLPQLLEWLAGANADVVALQETKLTDDAFPAAELQAAGYHSVWSGQKTYNGVALIARTEPDAVLRDMPGFDDPQRRVLAATVGGVRVIDLYVPNGQSVGSDKFLYKLGWLRARLARAAQRRCRFSDRSRRCENRPRAVPRPGRRHR